ncbi:MAG: hypothetical protein FWF99_07430, partial [Desulfovibrionaceae bacterium]|nr:hypothetical protein [Desulfovibrionaceae bacterium]
AAILSGRRTGSLAVKATRESLRVMRRLSLAPVNLPGYPVARLGWLMKAPVFLARRIMAWQAGRMPEAALSMRQDVIKRRGRTEIGDMNGAVVKQGEALGVPVDANREICRMVDTAADNAPAG